MTTIASGDINGWDWSYHPSLTTTGNTNAVIVGDTYATFGPNVLATCCQPVPQVVVAPRPKPRRRESITDNIFALIYCVLRWMFDR